MSSMNAGMIIGGFVALPVSRLAGAGRVLALGVGMFGTGWVLRPSLGGNERSTDGLQGGDAVLAGGGQAADLAVNVGNHFLRCRCAVPQGGDVGGGVHRGAMAPVIFTSSLPSSLRGRPKPRILPSRTHARMVDGLQRSSIAASLVT